MRWIDEGANTETVYIRKVYKKAAKRKRSTEYAAEEQIKDSCNTQPSAEDTSSYFVCISVTPSQLSGGSSAKRRHLSAYSA